MGICKVATLYTRSFFEHVRNIMHQKVKKAKGYVHMYIIFCVLIIVVTVLYRRMANVKSMNDENHASYQRIILVL